MILLTKSVNYFLAEVKDAEICRQNDIVMIGVFGSMAKGDQGRRYFH